MQILKVVLNRNQSKFWEDVEFISSITYKIRKMYSRVRELYLLQINLMREDPQVLTRTFE